jgi:glutaminyl-peptide cyclotransferase
LKRFILLCTLCLAGAAQAALPVYGFFVKKSYPHDAQAFTQGLYYRDGQLFESTGLHGQSTLRRVQLETGKLLQKQDIAPEYFGEGIAPVGKDIVSLTWQSQLGFVFDQKTFKLKRTWKYTGEGWGLADGPGHLYMSDGTSQIRVLDPATLKEVRRFAVKAEGKPIERLNELEWVDGELFANIWGADVIARINPATGAVTGWIDLTGLADPAWQRDPNDAVLNGIAWDGKAKRLFVTGKRWPALFEIELVLRKQR